MLNELEERKPGEFRCGSHDRHVSSTAYNDRRVFPIAARASTAYIERLGNGLEAIMARIGHVAGGLGRYIATRAQAAAKALEMLQWSHPGPERGYDLFMFLWPAPVKQQVIDRREIDEQLARKHGERDRRWSPR
jgi:hypothetical protein